MTLAKIIKSVDLPKTSLKKGAVLFTEGETGDMFFILKKGEIAIYKNYKKENQLEIARIHSGKVFGEISAMDGKSRSATAVAITDAEVIRVPANTLKHQLKECPGWFKAIVLDLVERLRKTTEALEKSGKNSAHVHSSMEETAKEHDAAPKPS